MLTSAEAEDWNEVYAMEAKRRQQLEQLFAVPLPPHLLQSIRDEIEEIIRIDQSIVSLGNCTRQTLTQDMRTVIKGRTAVNAYQQCGR